MTLDQLSYFGTMLYTGGGLLLTLIGSYVVHLRMKDKQKLDDLHDIVQILKAERVNEARVRELIRDEIAPLGKEIHEVKGTLSAIHNLVQQFQIASAEMRGRQAALDELRVRSTDTK